MNNEDIIIELNSAKSIRNPFDVNAELTGDTVITFKDDSNLLKRFTVPAGIDAHYLTLPANAFESTGNYTVTFENAGRTVVRYIKVIPKEASTNNCSGTCNKCNTCQDSCGCAGSLTASGGYSTVTGFSPVKQAIDNIKEEHKTFTTEITKQVTSTQNCIDEKVTAISEKVDTYKKNNDLKVETLTNQYELYKTEASKVINSNNELLSSIEEFEREKENQKLFDETKQELLDKRLKGIEDSQLVLQTGLNGVKLSNMVVDNFKKELQNTHQKISDVETTFNKSLSEAIKSFSETDSKLDLIGLKVNKIDGFENKLRTYKDIINEKLSNNKKEIDYKIKDLVNEVSNKAEASDVENLEDKIDELEECCKSSKEEIKSLKDRVCTLEGQVKDNTKIINQWQPLIAKFLAGGIDTLTQEQINNHISHIKAGN